MGESKRCFADGCRRPGLAGGAAWAFHPGGNTLTDALESIISPGADKKFPQCFNVRINVHFFYSGTCIFYVTLIYEAWM